MAACGCRLSGEDGEAKCEQRELRMPDIRTLKECLPPDDELQARIDLSTVVDGAAGLEPNAPAASPLHRPGGLAAAPWPFLKISTPALLGEGRRGESLLI